MKLKTRRKIINSEKLNEHEKLRLNGIENIEKKKFLKKLKQVSSCNDDELRKIHPHFGDYEVKIKEKSLKFNYFLQFFS